jgi:hypothetical protein
MDQEEWQNLCDKYIAINEEYVQASAVVTAKFAAIANGTSRENPTTEEMYRSDTAYENRREVIMAMLRYKHKHGSR